MESSIILTLSGYAFSILTGVASWFAGIRSRRNSVYQEMLGTIQTLTKQNSELLGTIAKLQDEVVEVRKENAELKLGQQAMTQKIDMLQAENSELRELVKKSYVPRPGSVRPGAIKE